MREYRVFKTICWLTMLAAGSNGLAEELSLPLLNCMAEQTGGFHDYPGDQELYEPALFHPRSFELEENLVFKRNLLDPALESAAAESAATGSAMVATKEGPERGQIADLYLTLRMTDADPQSEFDPVETELECRQVRGADGSLGFSCVNLPPSEMLLLNVETLRFTRASVGGWTFTGAKDASNGDSIYVEYGRCASQSSSVSSPGF